MLECPFNESSLPQIEMKQILLYCDPYMAEMETCCELLEPKVKCFHISQKNKTRCLL